MYYTITVSEDFQSNTRTLLSRGFLLLLEFHFHRTSQHSWVFVIFLPCYVFLKCILYVQKQNTKCIFLLTYVKYH